MNENIFTTTSLDLAAAISIYYPLEAIDKTNSQKASFIFKRDKELDLLIEAYWKGEMKVNPQVYFSAIKSLKSRLYSNE